MTRVLVVDNYDSFVYTQVGYLEQLGAQIEVVRNDAVPAARAAALIADFDAVVLSPGPGAPRDAGICIPVVRAALAGETPVLGVCLGHQAIAEAFGATVTHADELMHGKTSAIDHDDGPLYAGIAQGFRAARYHSLAVAGGSVPPDLVVTARTARGVIMGLRHRTAAIEGIQFHPESVLTEGGHRLFGNWLEGIGLTGAAERSAGLSPLVRV